jgi:ABC-type oligopeptide transport system substrate-binding subunit
MVEKKGSMFISPSSAYPDPSQFYEALFGKAALRNPSGIELPGFRELLDATMEAQDQGKRKEAFVKLQKFVTDNAIAFVHYISPSVSVRGLKVKNHQDSLIAVPKLAGVWLEA